VGWVQLLLPRIVAADSGEPEIDPATDRRSKI